jgi:membrane associated rhomboid family serine protease
VIPLRDANPTHRAPLVTLVLIAACFIAFAWELGVLASAGESGLNRFLNDHGAIPAEVSRALESREIVSDAFLGVLTSLFLHGGWLHLLGNLLFLWIFGNNVEDRLGRPAFLVFYLVGGIAAALTQVAIDPTSTVPVIGASGAIAATLGAYVVLYPRAKILSLVFLGFFYQLIEVPALLVLGFWFVLQLIDGIASLGLSSATEGGIAFFAHIGGFVAGVVIALAIRARRPQPPRPLRPATVG